MSKNNYTKKTILVAGASSRSGNAIAAYLLEKGAELVLPCHINATGIDALKKQFPKATILVDSLGLNSADSITERRRQFLIRTKSGF